MFVVQKLWEKYWKPLISAHYCFGFVDVYWWNNSLLLLKGVNEK